MAEDNRQKILDFAVAAIDSGGEASLRVHDVAGQAGVTVPVVYHYFGSREGLVIAAQTDRYLRQVQTDIKVIGRAVAECQTRDELRTALRTIWQKSLAHRAANRWRRISVLGSAYARPDLEDAIFKAQREVTAALFVILEPCRDRGWLRSGIDLTSVLAWHHAVLISRFFIEHGTPEADATEWDRLTLEALDRAFFDC